jgi:prepilin-type processing-associated H-X9-DG protein
MVLPPSIDISRDRTPRRHIYRGPNDEPFAYHPGGINVVMADASVRFMSDGIDGVAVKWLVGANDGQRITDF